MLNPERVDISTLDKNIIEIEFTDDNVDSVLTINLSRKDAHRLAIMILDQTSLKAQIERKEV